MKKEITITTTKRRPIISGVIYLGLGLFLLSCTTDLLPSIEKTWPIVIIIVGVAWVVGSLSRRDKTEIPAPGRQQ